MHRTSLSLVVLAALVTLAGCTGSLLGPDESRSPTTPVADRTDPASAVERQPISVVNNRSEPYLVTFRVIRGPVTALNLTFENGSVVTGSIDEPEQPTLPTPFVFSRNLTAVEPVGATVTARWSAAVEGESAISLPIPVERRNVTVLVVAKESATGTPLITTARLTRCGPPHTELRSVELHLREGRHETRGSASCG